MYIMSVPMYLHTHDVHDRNYTPIPLPTPSKANIWYAVSKEKGMFGMIISIGTDNSVPTSVTTELSIILLNKLQDHWILSKILLQFVKKRSIMYLYKNTFYEVEHGCKL